MVPESIAEVRSRQEFSSAFRARADYWKFPLTILLREMPVLTLSARPLTLILPVRPAMCAELFGLSAFGTPLGTMCLESIIAFVAV